MAYDQSNLYNKCLSGTLEPQWLEDYMKSNPSVSINYPIGEKQLTPLAIACEGGHINTVYCLLSKLADPDALSVRRRPPLFYATTRAQKNRLNIVKMLLTYGAAVDKRFPEDHDATAIMNAITEVQDREVVRALVARRASLTAENASGQSVRQLAAQFSMEEELPDPDKPGSQAGSSNSKEPSAAQSSFVNNIMMSLVLLVARHMEDRSVKDIVDRAVQGSIAGRSDGTQLSDVAQELLTHLASTTSSHHLSDPHLLARVQAAGIATGDSCKEIQPCQHRNKMDPFDTGNITGHICGTLSSSAQLVDSQLYHIKGCITMTPKDREQSCSDDRHAPTQLEAIVPPVQETGDNKVSHADESAHPVEAEPEAPPRPHDPGSGDDAKITATPKVRVQTERHVPGPSSDNETTPQSSATQVETPPPVQAVGVDDPLNVVQRPIKDLGLESFYPEGNPFPGEVAKKVGEIGKDKQTVLSSPDNLKRLANLALYHPLFYCDDSMSMGKPAFGNKNTSRFEVQRDLVNRMATVANMAVPDRYNNVDLHFINSEVAVRKNLSKEALKRALEDQELHSGSNLGTVLESHILGPLIGSQSLLRPLLVCIITDGCPTDNRSHKIGTIIGKCKEKLVHKGYKSTSVMFCISQIGDDPEATNFLAELRNDKKIQEVLHCTQDTDRLDQKYKELKDKQDQLHGELKDNRDQLHKELKKNHDQLDEWLLKILSEPIMMKRENK